MKKRKYLAIFMAMSMVAAPATALADDDAEIVPLQAETDANPDEDEVSDYKDADSEEEAAPVVQAEESKIDDITKLTDAINKAESGETIQLDGNIEGAVVVPADANITLDLNGHSITASADAIMNYGKLIVTDSQKTGKIVSTGNSGIGLGSGSETTIQYAQITGQEGAIGGYKDTNGATIEIKDGVFTGIDNAVVILNGSKREGKANTITINGGTFNGTIQSNGYVACGIYAPWKDEITVNDGTFNITGGAGIVARAGQVTVNGGEFKTTGTVTGKVGDSRVVVPCAAIVFDSDAGYPGMTDKSRITVSGGSFTSAVDTVSVVNTKADENKRVVASGGVFSDATAQAYTAEGYQAIKTTEGKYTVADSIALDKTSTRIRKGYTDTLKATVTANGETYDVADVAWTSDNEAIATVEKGVVTGNDYGTAAITAAVENTDLTAACDVTVYKKKSSSDSSSGSSSGGSTTVDNTTENTDNTENPDNTENTGGTNNTDQPAADVKTIVLQVGSTIARADGQTVVNDVAPVIRNSRTLVPVRFITEMLGGQVAWNETTKEVTLIIDSKEIKMTIGKVLEKYGVAPVIIDGRTFVPARFVADELGAAVAWDDATKAITIKAAK